MFVSLAAWSIGQSGIDALFFQRIGTDSLPLMYLLQGGTTFVAMLGLTGTLGKLEPRRAYILAPLVLGAVVVVERVVLFGDVRWIYPVLWVTVALGTLVQGVFLWGTAGAVVDTRQAKRLFPIFGAGGILGSVVGGLVTRPLAQSLGAENLLVVWTAGLAIAFVLCRVALGPPAAARARRPVAGRHVSALRDMKDGLSFVRRSRLLVWMAIAAALFSVLYYSLFLPYAQAATERFADADDLAGFFGLFWAVVTGAAFLTSMLLTNRLFGWFGVASMVIVLPVMYTGAFGILILHSSFITLVVLRFAIGLWMQGVASPAWETLVNVVPASRRDQTRAFLNGGPTQAGTAIAGLVALVGQQALSSRQFAVIGLIAGGLTVVATIGIRRSYMEALIDALRAGRPQVFERPSVRNAPVAIDRDAESVRILANSLRDEDVHIRRMAFGLLAGVHDEPSDDGFLEGLGDPDPIVRLTVVHALDVAISKDRDALLGMVDDDDTTVSAAAAARVVALADTTRPGARLRQLLDDPDDAVRRSVVEQLAYAPAEQAATISAGLLADRSAGVRSAALEILAAAAPERAIEPALAGIHDLDPEVRIAAGRALGRSGDRALNDILLALEDLRTLDAAIEAIRSFHAGGHADLVHEFVVSATERATRDGELADAISGDRPETLLLRDAILDRGRRSARSALWALTVLGRNRDAIEMGIENLDADPAQLAGALETLEVAGDASLVRPLLALWEPRLSHNVPSRRDWLADALDDDDDLIRRCADLVRADAQGGEMPRSTTSLSVMERVLFLRQVPLFSDLSPTDLERVASIADESGYAAGETIAAEGELGEELYIVVAGTIRVVRDREGSEHEIARRSAGEVVGEMSLITRTPRIASLLAEGDVRTIRLGRREFESILRERPSVALAVMRVLANRLGERDAR